MADLHGKTALRTLVFVTLFGAVLIGALLAAVPATVAEADNATGNATVTPTPTVAPTSLVTAQPTSEPTPATRTVFSVPRQDSDHVSINVNNTGGKAIQVEAYIETQSNKIIIPVDAGVSKRVSTALISAEQGQIIPFGFKAYENGTLVDSLDSTVTWIIQASVTPVPETATLSGRLLDSATRESIAGAKITLTRDADGHDYDSFYTGDGGAFRTPFKIATGRYTLLVEKIGYSDNFTSLEVTNVGPQELNSPVYMTKLGGVATPTPTQTPTDSPTPVTPLDAWLSLLYSPQTCIATVGGFIGLLVSLTVIYEWLQRQKERRKGEGNK